MTTPEYNPKIPQRKDIFATSADPFSVNFKSLANAFQVDHVALTAVSPFVPGNHNAIHLQEQSGPMQTDIGDFSVYGRPIKNQPTQVFMRYQGNPSEFRYVNYQIYPLPVIKTGNIIQTPFFTFLPGNFIIYFGSVVNNGGAVGDRNSVEYVIQLNPKICTKIVSVNCTGFNNTGCLTDSSVIMSNNIVTGVNFANPGVLVVAMPSAYYTIVGNTGS